VFKFAGLEVLILVLMKIEVLCCVEWQIILSDILKNYSAFTFGVKQFNP